MKTKLDEKNSSWLVIIMDKKPNYEIESHGYEQKIN